MTYYEEHKEERKAYQRAYRVNNLQQVRMKDNERKKSKTKAGKGAPPVEYPLVFKEKVVVSFE
jgi:hypothetical protein